MSNAVSYIVLTASFVGFTVNSTHAADPVEEDAVQEVADLARFFPWFEIGGVVGTDNSSRGETTLFVPLTQTHDSLVFTEWRGKLFEENVQEINAALGYRRMLNNGFNFGAWVGTDWRSSASNNSFWQIAGGFEALSEKFDLRANWYVPVTDAQTANAGLADVVVQAGNIVMIGGEEIPLYGADAEAGMRFDIEQALLAETTTTLGLYAGGFYFDHSDVDQAITGPKARVELAFNDLGAALPGAKFTAEYEYSWDEVRDSKHEFGLKLRIPLGKAKLDRGERGGQWLRMVEGLERDTDIVIGRSEAENVIDRDTGVEYLRYRLARTDEELQAYLALGPGTLIEVDGTGGSYRGGISVGDEQTLIGGTALLAVTGARTGTRGTYRASVPMPEFHGGIGINVNDVIPHESDEPHIASVGMSLGHRSKVTNVAFVGSEPDLQLFAPHEEFEDRQQPANSEEGAYSEVLNIGLIARGDRSFARTLEFDQIHGKGVAMATLWFGNKGVLSDTMVGNVSAYVEKSGFGESYTHAITEDETPDVGDDWDRVRGASAHVWLGLDGQMTNASVDTVTAHLMGSGQRDDRPERLETAIPGDISTEEEEPQMRVLPLPDAAAVRWIADDGTLSNARVEAVLTFGHGVGIHWFGERGQVEKVSIGQVGSPSVLTHLPQFFVQEATSSSIHTGLIWEGNNGVARSVTVEKVFSPDMVGIGQSAAVGGVWNGADGLLDDFYLGSASSGRFAGEFGNTVAMGFALTGENMTLQNSRLGPVISGDVVEYGASHAFGLQAIAEAHTINNVDIATVRSGNLLGSNSQTTATGIRLAETLNSQQPQALQVAAFETIVPEPQEISQPHISGVTVGSVAAGSATDDGLMGQGFGTLSIAVGLDVERDNAFVHDLAIGSVKSGGTKNFQTDMQSETFGVRWQGNSGIIEKVALGDVESGHNARFATAAGIFIEGANAAFRESSIGDVTVNDVKSYGEAFGVIMRSAGQVEFSQVLADDAPTEPELVTIVVRDLTVGNVSATHNLIDDKTSVMAVGMQFDADMVDLERLRLGTVSAGELEALGAGVVAGETTAKGIVVRTSAPREIASVDEEPQSSSAQSRMVDVMLGDVIAHPSIQALARGVELAAYDLHVRDLSGGAVAAHTATNTTDRARSTAIFWDGTLGSIRDARFGHILATASHALATPDAQGMRLQRDSYGGTFEDIQIGVIETSGSHRNSDRQASGLNISGGGHTIRNFQTGDILDTNGAAAAVVINSNQPFGGVSIQDSSFGNVQGDAIKVFRHANDAIGLNNTVASFTGVHCKGLASQMFIENATLEINGRSCLD